MQPDKYIFSEKKKRKKRKSPTQSLLSLPPSAAVVGGVWIKFWIQGWYKATMWDTLLRWTGLFFYNKGSFSSLGLVTSSFLRRYCPQHAQVLWLCPLIWTLPATASRQLDRGSSCWTVYDNGFCKGLPPSSQWCQRWRHSPYQNASGLSPFPPKQLRNGYFKSLVERRPEVALAIPRGPLCTPHLPSPWLLVVNSQMSAFVGTKYYL